MPHAGNSTTIARSTEPGALVFGSAGDVLVCRGGTIWEPMAISTGGVAAVVAGTGIGVDNTIPAMPVVSNTGVLTVGAGTGVSIGGTAQNPTIDNTGVLDISVDDGLSSSGGQSPTIGIAGPVDVAKLAPGADGNILQTVGGVAAWGTGINVGPILFGSGADGDLAPGFGAIVLTRNSSYRNITPGPGDSIDCAEAELFISGVLNLTDGPPDKGAIFTSAAAGGAGGAVSTAGSAGATNDINTRMLGGGSVGTNGGVGGVAGGTQAGAPGSLTFSGGGASGASGKGGTGSGGAGGASRPAVVPQRAGASFMYRPQLQGLVGGHVSATGAIAVLYGGQGSPGGGGGGGDGTAGAGGGGGATGGGAAAIRARQVKVGPGTVQGCVQANGGKGGAGGTAAGGNRGGGGGAAGAGGGTLLLVCGEVVGTSAIDALEANGGDGGAGGNGTGTGTGGDGGGGGTSGQIAYYNLSTGGSAFVGPSVAGTGGSPAVGTVGGNGGTGGIARAPIT